MFKRMFKMVHYKVLNKAGTFIIWVKWNIYLHNHSSVFWAWIPESSGLLLMLLLFIVIFINSIINKKKNHFILFHFIFFIFLYILSIIFKICQIFKKFTFFEQFCDFNFILWKEKHQNCLNQESRLFAPTEEPSLISVAGSYRGFLVHLLKKKKKTIINSPIKRTKLLLNILKALI